MMDAQDEIVRLLAIQVRKQFENQADAIREFDRAGFGPTRIAELLGTTAGTVNVALARAKKAPKKPAKPKAGGKA
jgi:DNA-directed RNA polymerase specialized sigma24 family protein